MESRDKFPPLENLKWKLIEEKAKQCDRSAKSKVNNSVLLSKNRFNQKQTETGSNRNNTKKKVNKFNGKYFNCDKNYYIIVL